MSHGEVRLRYSGFIMFLSRILSVGTGFLFVLMMTRNISLKEYGIYGNLGDVSIYFTLPSVIVPFWTTRFTARRHPGSPKTGLTANLLISIPFMVAYLLLLPLLITAMNIDEAYFVVYAIFALQMIESYATVEFEAILHAIKPEMIGFGLLAFEAVKIAAGFMFLMYLKLGLLGAVLSVIIANVARFIFYLKLTWHDLRGKVRWGYMKEWLKASPVNLYSIAGQTLASLTLILLFVYSGKPARGYYEASLAIASIVGYSGSLAFALYPRLLSESSTFKSGSQDVVTSLKMVLTFAIPMTAGAMALPDSYLTILNPDWDLKVARAVLILIAINVMFMNFSSVFEVVVTGTEKMDAEARISFKSLMKSKLFPIFTLYYIKAAAAIPLTYFALTLLARNAVEAATFTALIDFATNMALLLVRYILAQRCLNFSIPWVHIGKYVLASAVMAFVLQLLPHPERVLFTLALTALGGAVYFLVLLIMDRESRVTAKLAIREIFRIMRLRNS